MSLGAAVAGRQDADGFTAADPDRQTFYRELRPISAEFVPEALAMSGLDRERLAVEGIEPALALAQFTRWVHEVSGDAQPVMCAYPASFDWPFLYWYLIRFTGTSPFGHSGCLDMKTLYATKAGLPLRAVAKRTMPAQLLSNRPRTLPQLSTSLEPGAPPSPSTTPSNRPSSSPTSWRGRGPDRPGDLLARPLGRVTSAAPRRPWPPWTAEEPFRGTRFHARPGHGFRARAVPLDRRSSTRQPCAAIRASR
ncbi:hypothetical protein [Streptomyces sp. NPDC000618]|uniref:hypothetical protein n=1 Tax=Streptomyces sp. NPDC000618 TaxID=3154265 RepID=UPI00332450DC